MSLHACSTSRLTAMDTAVTRVVVFAMGPAARAPKPVWSCGGTSLACVSEYKCLGVMFPAEQGLAAGFLHLRGRLHDTGVLWQRQFAELGDGLSLELMRQLDLQAVPPAGSHACEVWGVRICQAAQNKPVSIRARACFARPGRSHTCSCGAACFSCRPAFTKPLCCGSCGCCRRRTSGCAARAGFGMHWRRAPCMSVAGGCAF